MSSREYKEYSLPESENYRIEILHNNELERVCYFAVNKNTNVPEVPFLIASDASNVLKDLESMIEKPKNKGNVAKLSTVQH